MDSIKMTTEQQLPKGWKKTTLGEICEIFDSKRVPLNREQREQRINNKKTDELFPYYGATGEVGKIDDYIFDGEFVLLGEDAAPFFEPNKDVAYCVKGRFWVNNHAHILSSSVLENLYICHYLNQFNFSGYVSGTTRLKLSQGSMKRIPIIYPTSKETQQAIVNKIESLFDEIDEGIGRLKTAAQQIQQYRQSLLKNAFNGELTKEWRSKHADALPSENELLAQIQTIREQHHAQQLANWQTAVSQWEQNGKEGKKPSKPKALTQAVKFEENVADLPSGWGVVKFENICDLVRNGISTKPEGESGTKIFRISAVRAFQLNLDDYRFINSDDVGDFVLNNGDLLFTRYNGTRNFVGVCAEFKSNEIYVYPDKLIRAVVNSTEINNTFLMYGFNTSISREFIESRIRTTAGQSGISGSDIKAIPVIICSLTEQTQIVAILESKLTACDQLAAELAKQLKQAKLLKQAVLKAAFQGELSE